MFYLGEVKVQQSSSAFLKRMIIKSNQRTPTYRTNLNESAATDPASNNVPNPAALNKKLTSSHELLGPNPASGAHRNYGDSK